MSRRWRNWCQNEVYEETKGADSRDKVKHNGRSLERSVIFRENDEGGRARVTTDEDRASTARTLSGDELMKVWRLGSYENFVGK